MTTRGATKTAKPRETLRPIDKAKAPGLFDVVVDGKVTGRRAFVRVNRKLRPRRFLKTASVREMKAWQEETRVAHRGKGEVAIAGTLAADIERYLESVAAMPSKSDRARDLYAWRRAFGDVPRASITSAMIRAQLHAWRLHGPRFVTVKGGARGERKAVAGPLSASAVNHRRTALLHLYTVLDGRGAPNPVREVPSFEEPPPEPRGRDVDVIRQLFALMPAGRTRAIAKVLFWGGIRGNSELGRMKPTFVTLPAGEAPAREALEDEAAFVKARAEWAAAAQVWVPTGKKGKPRLIVLNYEGVLAWREFLEAHKGRSDWTFSRGTLRQRLIYYARQLSIEGLRPYDLRHSIATALRKAGADLSDVAEHLGHTSLRMTKRYAPFQADKLRAAAERL